MGGDLGIKIPFLGIGSEIKRKRMKERVHRLITRGISNERRGRTFTFGLCLLIEEKRVLRFLPMKPLGRARSVHFLESVNRGLLKVKKERK